MDIRARMVLLGLVLGVLVAVIVASHGCGENHPRKRPVQTQAASAGSAAMPSVTAVAPARARACGARCPDGGA